MTGELFLTLTNTLAVLNTVLQRKLEKRLGEFSKVKLAKYMNDQ